MTVEDDPVVLIVEDETDLADLYAAWLRDHCTVETAYDGSEAIDAIDEHVDVVLLDRRMPGLSGDEVLDTIRDRDLDCRIAMVTAVEPDFDIVDMGFDDYLVKPVSQEDLVQTVEKLLLRSELDDRIQELFALASKKALLDGEKTDAELRASEEYARLIDRLAVLRDDADETLVELAEHDAYPQLLQELS